MQLEYYTLDSVLGNGKYKGYTIREVYQYAPSYIEWLIKYWEEFYIDLKLFDTLPKPTPFVKEQFTPITITRNNKDETSKIRSFNPDANNVENALEVIKEGRVILEMDFSFSDISKQILKEKLEGIYVKPKWTRWNDPEGLTTLSMDNFAD